MEGGALILDKIEVKFSLDTDESKYCCPLALSDEFSLVVPFQVYVLIPGTHGILLKNQRQERLPR